MLFQSTVLQSLQHDKNNYHFIIVIYDIIEDMVYLLVYCQDQQQILQPIYLYSV